MLELMLEFWAKLLRQQLDASAELAGTRSGNR
jgi:hypothetical protein